MKNVLLRVAFCAFAALCLYCASGPLDGSSRRLAQAGPTTVNFGRNCYNVIDFGADPTDSNPTATTAAFRAAFQAASSLNGVGVCAPAGRYKLAGDITLYSGATTGTPGGVSFYGAGPGLTVLDETTPGYVFDSCPTYSNVTPSMFIPSPCPALSAGPSNPTNPGTPLSGIVFSDFSIDVGNTQRTISGFYFPQISGLVVDDVCMAAVGHGVANNMFDFGQQLPNSFAGIIIRDSTCQTSFAGHFIALHGGGDGLTVERNTIRGNGGVGGTNATIPSLFLDTSDMVGGTANHLSWRYNDFEGPFFGMFAFLPAPTTFGTTPSNISNAEWLGNIYDGCGFFCYYFAAEGGQTPAPSFSNVRVSDRWAISSYDSLDLDGGGYVSNGTGVQGVKISGPSLYGGSGSGGSGGSVFLIKALPRPLAGFTNTHIAVVFPGAVATYLVEPSDSLQSVEVGLRAAVFAANGVLGYVPVLANSAYGAFPMRPGVAMAPGAPPIPYTVVTTGDYLRPVNSTFMCTLPPPLTGTPGPCFTGYIDQGDAIAFRNGVSSVDVTGVRAQSLLGASIHIWPNGARSLHVLHNVLGENKGQTSYTSLQIDPSPGPSDYDIEGNDLVGAANPIVAPLPTPSFLTGGLPSVMRNNRGAFAQIVGPTTASGLISVIIKNAGPLDCWYYFSAWTGRFNTSLTLPGTSATTLPNSEPSSVFLPVGASFTAAAFGGTATVTYVGFCQP